MRRHTTAACLHTRRERGLQWQNIRTPLFAALFAALFLPAADVGEADADAGEEDGVGREVPYIVAVPVGHHVAKVLRGRDLGGGQVAQRCVSGCCRGGGMEVASFLCLWDRQRLS